MISEPHWAALIAACGNLSNPNPTQACDDAINVAGNDGGDYNIYDVYDTCPSPVLNKINRRAPSAWLSYLEQHKRKLPQARHTPQVPDKCVGSNFGESWLDNPTVQAALHVTAANVNDWSVCAGIGYSKTAATVLNLYPNLIKNYKVLVYSGDVDACVPYNGSEDWVRNLGYPVSDAWRPWLVNDQVAGYVTSYTAAHPFQFITVKGAGHMVPQYTPQPALEMISRWIKGTPF